ncbi:MAG: YifB family Mg chelatase-like AAA ATPase [Acidimicrobiales bacterium]
MLSCISSATLHGVDGSPVSVEVHVSNGLPGFTVVGLPDAAVRESRDRVRAALLSSGLTWPLRRVTVNLAPSGVRKNGSGLDLPIAVGLLVASGQLEEHAVAGKSFIGELGLDGSLRSVAGVIPMVDTLAATPNHRVVVPKDSAGEAGLAGTSGLLVASSLNELVSCLNGHNSWPEYEASAPDDRPKPHGPDLADVRGQIVARRALEIAAAGSHHILFVGTPGSGKTMLAARLSGLLPSLTRDESIEVSRIYSAAGMAPGALPSRPPMRAPHHSSSEVSIVGGGTSAVRPGEISLAHCGVLFFDELGEFPATVLDLLRQPLEEGEIRLSRSRVSVTFPSRFQLVAAMNPCPCGERETGGTCRCLPSALARYTRRISGPLLDRFDLAVPMSRPDPDDLFGGPPGESTAVVAERVAQAREQATQRGVKANAYLPSSILNEVAPLDVGAANLLERRLRSGAISARGFHRIHRVALTIADLDSSAKVTECHVAEAVQLRVARDFLVPD